MQHELQIIRESLSAGSVIPYLGPAVLELEPATCKVPATPESLVATLTAKVSVPHKIRNNLTATAQFIENFKHRKTLVSLMTEAYAAGASPNALHRFLAALPKKPLLVVDSWYSNAMTQAFAGQQNWGMIQGVSQSEHFGQWVQYLETNGVVVEAEEADAWTTVLYQPLGSNQPAQNYIISDSDYVEVLTEIDIQTPIPPLVQELRQGAHFLFMGCRFNHQLTRTYARQIMKRSSAQHWAVISGPLTRMEEKFLAEQQIRRIDLPLANFVHWLETAELAQPLAAA